LSPKEQAEWQARVSHPATSTNAVIELQRLARGDIALPATTREEARRLLKAATNGNISPEERHAAERRLAATPMELIADPIL
jgi:hypothetical protein